MKKVKKPVDGFTELRYKGVPVLSRDYIPKYEVWFVNSNNMVIEQHPAEKHLTFWDRLRIYFKTLVSEI
jgi:hypothetical protein